MVPASFDRLVDGSRRLWANLTPVSFVDGELGGGVEEQDHNHGKEDSVHLSKLGAFQQRRLRSVKLKLLQLKNWFLLF